MTQMHRHRCLDVVLQDRRSTDAHRNIDNFFRGDTHGKYRGLELPRGRDGIGAGILVKITEHHHAREQRPLVTGTEITQGIPERGNLPLRDKIGADIRGIDFANPVRTVHDIGPDTYPFLKRRQGFLSRAIKGLPDQVQARGPVE